MTFDIAPRLPYEHPTAEVLEFSLQQIVCVSEYDNRSIESPNAPTGTDHAW